MVEIETRQQLRAWLERHPHAATPIAARAALRVLPLVEPQPSSLILAVCHAVAIAWIAGNWSNSVYLRELAALASEAAADAADFSAKAGDGPSHPASRASRAASRAAAYAARAVVDAATSGLDSAVRDSYITEAAAYAASRAADAAAHSSLDGNDAAAIRKVLWSAVSQDVAACERNAGAEPLLDKPLWPDAIPENFARAWAFTRNGLLGTDDGWQVWTDWYDRRLVGMAETGMREIGQVLKLSKEDWDKGPAHVNALLANADRSALFHVPDQRRAVIEVELGPDGRIHRKPPRTPVARDGSSAARQRAAWNAHDGHLRDIEAMDPGRNAPMLKRALGAYRRAFGASFDLLDVIGLGMAGERLKQFSARADEFLVSESAAELQALAANHTMLMPQFPDWIEYLREVEGDSEPQASMVAVAAARAVARAEQFIAPDVAEPLNGLADMVEPAMSQDGTQAPSDLNARELNRSLGNVIAAVLRPLLNYARDVGRSARQGSVDGVGTGTKVVVAGGIPAVIAALNAESILAFAAANPRTFGWIIDVVNYLKSVFL